MTGLLGILMLWCQLQATPVATPGPRPTNQLEPLLLQVLRDSNPEISRVAVLDVQTPSPGGPYVLVGWGIRADQQFRGDFRDELFGIFVLDQAWSRIERTLEILPTPRWLDYELHIESVTSREVVVVGKGTTYGDGPIRRTYSITK